MEPTSTPNSAASVSRRSVVVGAAGLSVATLAACSSSSTPAATASSASSAASAASSAGSELAKVADIPVGGGKIFTDAKVVVTQPTAGNFKGFSTTCPHKGCAVAKIENSQIVCPCHGSMFGLDGTVTQGPATSPLSPAKITVTGTSISLG